MASPIIVYHVGGGADDDFGPIQCVEKAGFELVFRTFEAQDGDCIDDHRGARTLYVNKHPMSSGLFPGNPRYANETFGPTPMTWGKNTEVDHTVTIPTTTIDILAAGKTQPDVLSIDAQGAELNVMRGASSTLRNVLCVVSEVEFAPIYEGQPLFDEQMAFLTARGFRLMELFSAQKWHYGPAFGEGFLTVAEAVWLRFDFENLTAEQVEALAKIAAGFGRLSYAMRLIQHLGGKVSDPLLAGMWKSVCGR